MNRILNFNAGPSTLPLPALERARDDLVDYQGKGMSILEMSHRGAEYLEIQEKTKALFRELLQIPASHHILFLGGGASFQFAMIPMNLLGHGKSADFAVTGSWAKKALQEAKRVGKTQVIYDGVSEQYTRLPDPKALSVHPDAAYVHLTSNETIGGVEWMSWPETGKVPMVCDMSSDIMSRPIPVDRFGLIYAGAQKNLGPAGTAVVILRNDVLEACSAELPTFLSYKTHVENDSLYNTPPVFTVYLIQLTLQWLREQGGIAAAEQWARTRADILYQAIDGSGGFYRCPVPVQFRSRMNVVFRLPSEDQEKKFIDEAKKQGMVGLKGHRSVGGCRASIYNAMPLEGAQTLASFMKDFAKKQG